MLKRRTALRGTPLLLINFKEVITYDDKDPA